MLAGFAVISVAEDGYVAVEPSSMQEGDVFTDNDNIAWEIVNGSPQTTMLIDGEEVTRHDASNIIIPLRVYEDGLHMLTVFPNGWTAQNIAEYMTSSGLYSVYITPLRGSTDGYKRCS